MSTSQAMRDGEIARTNPPYVELIDEVCDGDRDSKPWPIGNRHELDDNVYVLPTYDKQSRETGRVYLCSGCYREKLVKHFQTVDAGGLDEYPWDVVGGERCSDCHLFRCDCERI